MGIKGNHLKCGHQLMICPYCLHTGCNYSSCENSIGGPHTSAVCEMCGNDGTEYMENYQYIKQQRAMDAVQEKEANRREMNELKSRVKYTSYGSASTPSIALFFNLKFIIFMSICTWVSFHIRHDQFEGIPRVLVGCINIVGAIGSFIYIIVCKLSASILNSM